MFRKLVRTLSGIPGLGENRTSCTVFRSTDYNSATTSVLPRSLLSIILKDSSVNLAVAVFALAVRKAPGNSVKAHLIERPLNWWVARRWQLQLNVLNVLLCKGPPSTADISEKLSNQMHFERRVLVYHNLYDTESTAYSLWHKSTISAECLLCLTSIRL